ncbi:MAG: NAD(P)/FAD-dependent oxidoreductase [Deltaproteobacteria bacterium]|nr:NAD(P)/FAD-dependent oxidoreductase [Deltaproteobacteria bacterium]MBW2302086.1 NAD(P)/FAD-dependent oxidoreductase [Deltaproteobacteria bacterium]
MAEYDGIVIGAGPNGLLVAAYLAKAGQRILLLERRFEMGGGLCSEHITIPTFIHNTHAIYIPMVDYAPFFQDFKYEMETLYDLKFIFPDPVMSLSLLDGRSLCIHQDPERTAKSIAQFSEKDARTYVKAAARFKEYMDLFIAPATYSPPHPAMEAMTKMQNHEIGRDLQALQAMSPKSIVEELFENEHVRTLFLYASTMWGLDYDLEGLGFLVPLYINRAANYRLVVGGSHHLAHLMSKVIYRNGGMIIGPKPVTRIVLENGRAKGVETEDGYYYEAEKFIVSTLNPHQTFLDLVGEENLEAALVTRIKDWKWEKSSFFHVHTALFEAPRFKAADKNPEVAGSFIHLFGYESYEELIAHQDAIKRGELRDSGFNSCFPTLHDPSQAPPGKHTGLISCHAPYHLADGGADRWYDIRDEIAERCLAKLRQYVPNVNEETIMWRYITTPKDIHNKFVDMREGSYKQGAYLPLQMGYLRPNEHCAEYATPIKDLYICGSCTYPGGTVLLANGYNAANRIAEDYGIEKWWKKPESIIRAEELGLL